MLNRPIPRLDKAPGLREALLRHCRLKPGDVWDDPLGRHRVACADATDQKGVTALTGKESAKLAVHDPPYNQVAFAKMPVDQYVRWCQRWVENTDRALGRDSAMYVWLGADQSNEFQPLPDFMVMMRGTSFSGRSFITLRNQRGYGTSMNWMAAGTPVLR